MNLFITGIHGFLGSAMAEHFRRRGHTVTGSARNSSEGVVALRIGEPFDPAVFRGSDVVIHAAHDFTAGAKEKNIRGTRAWFEAAAGARQVFFSSYSARPDAASEYGATKYAIEKMFLDAGQAVVRPGLVIGDGGLFAKQRAALRKTPIVPLIAGGSGAGGGDRDRASSRRAGDRGGAGAQRGVQPVLRKAAVGARVCEGGEGRARMGAAGPGRARAGGGACRGRPCVCRCRSIPGRFGLWRRMRRRRGGPIWRSCCRDGMTNSVWSTQLYGA